MDPLHDYDECVAIEEARCERRGECQAEGTLSSSFKKFDRDTCVSHAKEHCRIKKLGQDLATDTDSDPLSSCIEAIGNVDCKSLDPKYDETERLPECWFIDPLPEAEEEESDGGSDAGA
jgi:hypothetical protein